MDKDKWLDLFFIFWLIFVLSLYGYAVIFPKLQGLL